MTPRRAYTTALSACLIGAALVIAAGGQPWVHASLDRGVGAPIGSLDLIGRELAGPITGLGLVGLAGVAALVATRGWFRRAIGVLLDAVGIWAIVVSIIGRGSSHIAAVVAHTSPGATVVDLQSTAWPWIGVAGGVLVSAAGAITVATGGRWSSMSGRYDAPRKAAAADDPWTAMDRGDDPTI